MGPVFMVAATVISAAGAAAAGVAASNQAKYQAEVSKQNAAFAKQKGDALMQDYATKSLEKGMDNRAMLGKMEAGLASSGLELTGSTKDVMSGQRKIMKMGDYDYGQAIKEDWYATRKEQYSNLAQAALEQNKSETSLYAGAMNAGSSLMSGGAKLQENYNYFG